MRIAGSAGIGEGDRPYLPNVDGEPGAFEPLKDDLLEDGLSIGGGGNIEVDGVLATEVAGVKGVVSLFDPEVEGRSSFSRGISLATDSASLTVDSRRNIRGLLLL